MLRVVALLAVGIGSLYAQRPLYCFAASGVGQVVRAEGQAELVGDFVINCRDGIPGELRFVSFQYHLNTAITSRMVTPDLSEAVLMIDEPGLARLDTTGAASSTPTPFCLSPRAQANADRGVACNPSVANQTFQQGTYTVFRATRGAGRNVLTFSAIPITSPGNDQYRTIRISNVRADARSIGPSTGLVRSQISAFVAVSPSGILPIWGPQQPVGFLHSSLFFDVTACHDATPLPPESSLIATCAASQPEQEFFDNPTRAGALPARGVLRFWQGFGNAFRPALEPLPPGPGQANSVAGVRYHSESGFVRPETGVAGLADSGTRLAARFTNVPAGLRLFVGTRTPLGPAYNVAVLVPADSTGASISGGPSVTRPVPLPPASTMQISCGLTSTPGTEIPVVNGEAMAVWEVVSSNLSSPEGFAFPYAFAWRSQPALGLPGNGTVRISGTLAPFDKPAGTAPVAASEPPIPRFSPLPTSDPRPLVTVRTCGGVPVTLSSGSQSVRLRVDGAEVPTPATLWWNAGEIHVVEAPELVYVAPGSRVRFRTWSNGAARRQTIVAPAQPMSLTANFASEFELRLTSETIGLKPERGGYISMSPTSQDGYFTAGSWTQLSATPVTGKRFQGWNLTSVPSVSSLARDVVTVNAPTVAHAYFISATDPNPTLFPASFSVGNGAGTEQVDGLWHRLPWGWTVTSNQAWVTAEKVQFGSNFKVLIRYQANPTPMERSATVMVGDRAVPITQAPTCRGSLSSTTADAPASVSTGEFQFTSEAPACRWTGGSDSRWLQPFPISGTGAAKILYTAFPNFSARTRSGVIRTGETRFTVTQQPGTGTAMERFVRLLYFNFFGRQATDAEVASQIASGLAPHQLAIGFLNSEEFNLAGRFVAGLYVGLLNRNAEHGGWLFQRNALTKAVVNPDSLVANFLNGAEFQATFGPLTNAQLVDLLYQQVLGRAPSGAELAWRVGLLTNESARVAFARDLLNSAEFRTGTNARLTAFLVYATLINRDPSDVEHQQREGEILFTEGDARTTLLSILQDVTGSPEFVAQFN